MKPKEKLGVFRKFKVTRTDGESARGKKHARCRYFVLDIDHDPHARTAIWAYAKSCARMNPKLAQDLRQWVMNGEWPLA